MPAAPIVGLICCGIVHMAAANLTRGTRTLGAFIVSFLVGGLVCTALAAIATAAPSVRLLDRIGSLGTAWLTYGGLAYCYINFVNVAIASLRVRILTELAASDTGTTEQDLIGRYGVRDLVGVRLERLSRSGQLTARNGRFYHRPSAIYFLALCLSLFKQLVLGSGWGRNLEGNDLGDGRPTAERPE